MPEFAERDYVPHIPSQHTSRLKHQKSSPSLSKVHRPLTRFYCNDCQKKFKTRILGNRTSNAVQHYCSLYQKIITRKVNRHSQKCNGEHGMGPCVVQRINLDCDSDSEDETKVAYYADKGKTRPNLKSRHVRTKKRKREHDYVPTPSKRQRRNSIYGPQEDVPHYAHSPPPTKADCAHDPYYAQQTSSTPHIAKARITASHHNGTNSHGYNDDNHDNNQTEQEQRTVGNTEFEVLNIKKHIILDGKILYNISWKQSLYISVNEFLPWLKEVNKVKKMKKDKTMWYKVTWKDSWVAEQDLKCTELLAAYVLTELKRRSEAEVARNRFKESCCQMLHYAVDL
eukprot:259593_1